MSDWIAVAKVGELAPGQWRTMNAGGTTIVVINFNGDHFAIEDMCTHDGGKLTGGEVQGDEIVCPRHGAVFCIRTGKALVAPAFEPIATFPVRIEDGEIQVRDDRWD